MSANLDKAGALALDAVVRLFDEARTAQGWLPKPVSVELLRRCYEHARWAPTSANTNPGRFAFVMSQEGKAALQPAIMPGNLAKTMSAPCTVIVASDPNFHRALPALMPGRGEMAMAKFEADPQLMASTAARNTVLQGAYFIMAARALGLDCGPMSGFDPKAVDDAFFAGSGWQSDFLINIGFADPSTYHPRNPRLAFEDATRIL